MPAHYFRTCVLIAETNGQPTGDKQTFRMLVCVALPCALAIAVFYLTLELNVWILFDEWMKGPSHLCHWDCGWYITIAENGYERPPQNGSGVANYGFYPGFPYLARVAMQLLNLGFVSASLLLNCVLLFAFAMVAWVYRDTLKLNSDRTFVIFLLAFALSPWSVYNRIPYSEMSFNFALLLCFVAWRRDHLIIAAIGGFLLCTIRVTGAILPALLMIELLWQKRQNLIAFVFSFDRRLCALAFMGSGFIVVCIQHYIITGDPFVYFQAQREGWHQELRNPMRYFSHAMEGRAREVYSLAVFFPVILLLILGKIRAYVPTQLAIFSLLVFLIPFMR